MTVYESLLTSETTDNNNDNFKVNVTEKKIGKLFKNVSKLFDDVVEIESVKQMWDLDTSKLDNQRTLIIFYELEFDLDDLHKIDDIFSETNVSIVFCDCNNFC